MTKIDTTINAAGLQDDYRIIFDSVRIPVLVSDKNGRICSVNTEFLKLSNYSRNEIEQRLNWSDFLDKNTVSELLKCFHSNGNNSKLLLDNYECRVKVKNGSYRDVFLSIKYSTVLKKYIFSLSDCSRFKATQEKLQKTEQKLDLILRNVPDIIYSLDPDGRILFVNDVVKKYGYDPDELIGKDVLELVHQNDREKARFRINERRTGERRTQSLEIHLLNRNKKSYIFEVNWNEIDPVFQIDAEGVYSSENHQKNTFLGTIGVARDITERKILEKELKESEEKFRKIFDNANDLILYLDKNGKILEVNTKFVKLFGYSREEFVGKNITDLGMFSMSDFPPVMMLHPDKDDTTKKFNLSPYIKTRRDNGLFLECSASLLKIDKKEIRIMVIARDITDKKRAEQIVRNNENKFREIVENANEVLFTSDRDGIFNYISPSCEMITGFSPEELNNKHFKDFIYQEDHIKIEKDFGYIIKTGENIFKHYRIKHKSGDIKWIQASCSPVKIGQRIIGVQGIIADITEQKQSEDKKKKLENQLFQTQKLESIGRLAGGIAHDFNNILTGIMGYAELLSMQFNNGETQEKRAAEVILKGVERAASLTKQLLDFARKGKFNPIPMNINEVIKDVIRVSDKIFEKKIVIKYDLEEDIPAVEADKNQLDQVITNLIINAKDAMPDGGEILFKTEKVFLDEEDVKSFPEIEKGDYVKFSVSDTGCGMPKEVQQHIFEPFFTTKSESKGTGLGLATVYGIIKNHRGHITCNSVVGFGSVFTIYLPVSEASIVQEIFEREVMEGNETVLVIDDEDSVREITRLQLETMGYKVFEASDGMQGIGIYEQNKDSIDLVLLDMIMPGTSGRETFREIYKINPEVKSILMSGYSQEGKANKILDEGVTGYIQKPFRMQELSEVLYKALKT